MAQSSCALLRVQIAFSSNGVPCCCRRNTEIIVPSPMTLSRRMSVFRRRFQREVLTRPSHYSTRLLYEPRCGSSK